MKLKQLITSAFMGIAFSSIAFAQQGTREAAESTLKDDLRGNPSKVNGEVPDAEQDAIFVKDGTMMVRKDNKSSAMEADMKLSDGTMVMMDGTVKTKDGNVVMLNSGDEVGMDGKIMKRDILVLRDGQLMIKRDGDVAPVTETRVIGDGTKVMTDGTIMMKDGKTKKLSEGQQIDWDGRIKDGDIAKDGPPGKRQ